MTDEGVKALAINDQLMDLDVIGCNVTPGCIDDLARFKNLRTLRFSVQNWKKADVERLQSLLRKIVN